MASGGGPEGGGQKKVVGGGVGWEVEGGACWGVQVVPQRGGVQGSMLLEGLEERALVVGQAVEPGIRAPDVVIGDGGG